jgi:CHAD domain-containing protein
VSYRFSRDETVGEAVSRIMGELVEESLGLLDSPDPSNVIEAVHETRKNCKKGRGLVRLIRPALADEYQEANRELRDAARALGPIRDSQAILQTFDDLVASAPELVPDRGVLGVREELAARSKAATEAVLTTESDRLDDARSLLEAVGTRSRDWDLPDAFDPIGGGVRKTYKRGRNGLEDVLEAPRDEGYHEWRKRVKYLWYQTRLLRDSAPSILRPLARRLHDLSDALGDAHDLTVLHDQMVAWDHDRTDNEIEAVEILIRGRKKDLEERAESLGMRLYAEKPDAFANRIEGYWAAWQRTAPSKAGELEDLFPPEDALVDQTMEELRALAADAGISGRSAMNRDELESSLRAAGV